MATDSFELVETDRFAVPTMVCPECGKTLPQPEFILSLEEASGLRRSLCRDCHAKQPAKLAAEKEATRKADQFRDLIRAVGKVTAATISELNTELMADFDGVKEFAKFYGSQLRKAATTNNGEGSAKVLAGCAGIAKIIAMSTQYQASLPEVSLLSDDELAAEWQRGLASVVAQLSPEEVKELLGEDVNKRLA